MLDSTQLLADVAIIMATAGVALVACRLLRLPPVLGYLVAGILVGPYTFFFPTVHDIRLIQLLAELGLVLLLFDIGLEFGWERIRQLGLRVVFIGLVEITAMLFLGYQVGLLLGWTKIESVFLGAAISISSSAVLVKVLRDTGQLQRAQGRLIVGILVVEDFAAVLLLTILSGVAKTGVTDTSTIMPLVVKIGVFFVAALAFGGLLAPRVTRLAGRLASSETLLVASLAMCFGLAYVAHRLGLSAAAGGFLIGAVLGDTEQSENIRRVMAPVRDMFAALFFVSIGMLVDVGMFTQFFLPALVVTLVFVVGKIIANTVGTFLAGRELPTALRVGMGMPQTGEFSLAMVKVGGDHGALSAFVYPVITVTTGITALLYPFIFRSAGTVVRIVDGRMPALMKRYLESVSMWLATVWSAAGSHKSLLSQQLQRAGRRVVLNVAIIMVLTALGSLALESLDPLSTFLDWPERTLGLAIGGGVIAVCMAPALAVWRGIWTIADMVARREAEHGGRGARRAWRAATLRVVLRDSLILATGLFVGAWSLPFTLRLLALVRTVAPPFILVIIAAAAFAGVFTFKIHAALEATFTRTFLGGPGETAAEAETPAGKGDA